jgi:hypothetical protein
VEPTTIGGVASLDRPDRIRGHRRSRRDVGQRAPVGSGEPKRPILRALDAVALLVNRAVMAPAQQDEIRQRRRPALGPVLHVVGLATAHLATREATGPIAVTQSPPERRRDGARPGPDLHHPTGLVVPHHYPARIAREAPRRSRGNVADLVQLGLAGCLRIREHRRVDMDDHLVPLAGRTGIELVVQRALGEQPQRIGLLLRPGGRREDGIGDALPPIQRLPRRIERAQE